MRQLSELQEFLIYNVLQLKLSLQLSGIMGVVGLVSMNISEKLNLWFVENIDYVVIALGFVAVDHVLGSIVHYFYLKDWCWKKNIIGLLIKLSMVLSGGLIFEGLTHITIEQDLIYSYLKMTTRLLVIIYPGLSAMKSCRIITKGAFPPAALVGKFDGFNKDLDIEKLKKGKEDE